MKIIDARVIVSSPGRNLVTLKIETEDGISGIGDATLNGRELAVVAYLQDHVVPCLIGRDARRIEDIWQYLYRGAYWRRGPVTMTAIAAVDVALWDIKAKAAGMPLYQLLGGRSREGALAYGHADGRNLEEALASVEKYRKAGYRAIRVQCGLPDIEKVYGVHVGEGPYEPAQRGLPEEERWSTPAYMRFVPTLFAAVRENFGEEVALLHDVHHRLTPNEAARVGKDLEPYRLFFMEDATPAENQEGFRLIRRATTTPLATGEVFNSVWDAKALITEQLIDYVRATIVHAGGISHMRTIASLAGLYGVRTGFHGATDLSPVTLGAAIHFDTWLPNFGIQEYMAHAEETMQVFSHGHRFEDGYLIVSEAPGHGVEIDEAKAALYPYQPAYLPVNRLEDGTVWDW
ncbi:D-mannonate dehydratase ManD [Afifella sp. IM 167]|uniref:D-mannonate dehydratase ManD n=1 Tax=Afifella sp. IM 167 TaxID=2033586 RepID=UPI001CCC6876|nr:bifunctional D-altronate/D-mannonate dehydratase [Afifella sp. IM 167]